MASMILIFSNIIDVGNVADLQFQSSSISVVEEPGAMAEVCVVLNNLAPGVTLGCEVTATVAVSDGNIAST